MGNLPVDGTIYAQPLVIPQAGGKNLLLVATSKNEVYFFDADNADPGGGFHAPIDLGTVSGDSVPACELGCLESAGPKGGNISLSGIVSTPAVDTAANVAYVVAELTGTPSPQQPCGFYHQVFRIDLTSYAVTAGPIVAGSVPVPPGAEPGVFDSDKHIQRPGLLLNQGLLFLAFSGSEDSDPYHGWLFAYDTTQAFVPTLAPSAIWCSTCGTIGPGFSWGGIWQSGAGIATDGTYIYVQTGNGVFQSGGGLQGPASSFGNSFVKLGALPGPSLLQVQGTFTPAEGASPLPGNDDHFNLPGAAFLSFYDLDPSVSGVALIGPGLAIAGSKRGKLTLVNTNAIQNQMVIGETPGVVTSINATCRQYTLGCTNPATPFPQASCENALEPATPDGSPSMYTLGQCDGQCPGILPAGDGGAQGCPPHVSPACIPDPASTYCLPAQFTWPHIHGTPVWWAENSWVYVWGQYDYLRRYTVDSAAFAIDPGSMEKGAQVEPATGFGGILSLSKTVDGSQAILWSSNYLFDPPHNDGGFSPLAPACVGDGGAPLTYNYSEERLGILRAYDAKTMAPLWSNESGPAYAWGKFVPPTIANGNVYLASNTDGIIVYAGSKDPDHDGVPSGVDNCPYAFNQSQENTNIVAEATIAFAAANPLDPVADGHVPAASDPVGYTSYWQTTYPGDACDPNASTHITASLGSVPTIGYTECPLCYIDQSDYSKLICSPNYIPALPGFGWV